MASEQRLDNFIIINIRVKRFYIVGLRESNAVGYDHSRPAGLKTQGRRPRKKKKMAAGN